MKSDMKKRMLSGALALLMAFGPVPFETMTAYAAEVPPAVETPVETIEADPTEEIVEEETLVEEENPSEEETVFDIDTASDEEIRAYIDGLDDEAYEAFVGNLTEEQAARLLVIYADDYGTELTEEPAADAVAMIGSQSYATLKDALDAVNNQTDEDVVLTVLGDIEESITASYKFTKNVTITAHEPVSLDFQNNRSGCYLMPADGKTLTIGENISIDNLFSFGADRTSGTTVVDGTVKAQYVRAYGKDDAAATLIVDGAIGKPTNNGGEAQVRISKKCNVVINGSIDEDADVTFADVMDTGLNVNVGGTTEGNFKLNNASVSFLKIHDGLTTGMNINFELNHSNMQLAGADYPDFRVTKSLKMDATSVVTVTSYGKLIIDQGATAEIAAGTRINAKGIENSGTIEVDLAGTTVSDKTLLIDYTGAGTIALADYGTVTCKNGAAGVDLLVENSDLYAALCVAQIDTNKYGSLADAVAAAQNGDTITLLVDTTEDIEIPVGVSFDTNGKNYTGTVSAPDGYVVVKTEDVYTVRLAVAQVGEKKYPSLNAAVAAAQDGDTVVLLADLSGDTNNASNYGIWIEQNITLDMNDKTISGKFNYGVVLVNNASVTIKNGTLKNIGGSRGAIHVQKESSEVILDNMKLSGPYGVNLSAGSVTIDNGTEIEGSTYGLVQYSGSTINMKSGSVKGGYYGAYIFSTNAAKTTTLNISGGTLSGDHDRAVHMEGNCTYTDGKLGAEDTRNAYPVVLNVTGGTLIGSNYGVGMFGKGTVVNMSHGSISGGWSAITGNGARDVGGDDNSGTEINITGGTLTGSTVIYHPQYGDLNISGGTLTGTNTGVEMRAGNINVTGGTIISTADHAASQGNNSGSTTVGAAIAVSQHATKLPISVNITGGTMEAVKPFQQTNVQGNSDEDLSKIEISISDGEFTATNGGTEAVTADNADIFGGFVSGGTFNTPVSAEVCDKGFIPADDGNGNYGVESGVKITIKNNVNEDVAVQCAPMNTGFNLVAPSIGGKVFQNWTDENDKVVSYTANYYLMAKTDMTLIAVYGEEAVPAQPTVTMTSVTADKNGTKYTMHYTATFDVPDDYEVLERGIIYSTNQTKFKLTNLDAVDNNLKLGNSYASYITTSKSSSKAASGTHTLNLNISSTLKTKPIWVRGYVKVKKDDKTTYIYSDIVSKTFNETI